LVSLRPLEERRKKLLLGAREGIGSVILAS
jgi:hypothetical protein